MRTKVRAPGVSRSASRTASTSHTGSPASSATRSRSDSAKSISPAIARSVIATTCSLTPARAASTSMRLVLDQRRVDVEHDQPLGPPPQARPARPRRRRRTPRRTRPAPSRISGRIGAAHDHLDAARPAWWTAGRSTRCCRRCRPTAGRCGRARPARRGRPMTITWLRPPGPPGAAGPPGRRCRRPTRRTPCRARRAACATELRSAAGVTVDVDQHGQDQPVADDDLLDVADVDVVGGQRREATPRSPPAGRDRSWWPAPIVACMIVYTQIARRNRAVRGARRADVDQCAALEPSLTEAWCGLGLPAWAS